MPALAVDATTPVAHAIASCDAAARFPAPPVVGFAAVVVADPVLWSVDFFAALYNVDGWGAPYFFVNDDGDVVVCPHGPAMFLG